MSSTIQSAFDFLINILASVIQVVVWPINQLVNAALPDLSQKIIDVSGVLNTMFDNMTWALGVVPRSIVLALIFIISVEIARHTIFISTHIIIKIWDIIQRIKFW